MHRHRPLPKLEEMDETYLTEGHLWIQEYVIGGLLRFRMEPTGLLHFGDSTATFDDRETPPHYQCAVDEIRQQLDRDRLREGVETVESYTFIGVVPLGDGVEYDWAAVPSFMGHDIWDGTASSFAPEDVVERVFNVIGLETVPTFEKEVPARHFEPRTYSFPKSGLMETAVPGVVLRMKHGQPAVKYRPEWSGRAADRQSVTSNVETLDEWAERVLSSDRLHSLLDAPDGSIWTLGLDEMVETVTGELARREFGEVGHQIESRPASVESAISDRIEALRRAEIE